MKRYGLVSLGFLVALLMVIGLRQQEMMSDAIAVPCFFLCIVLFATSVIAGVVKARRKTESKNNTLMS